MAIEIEAQVGPQVLSDGTTSVPRLEKSGALVVTELHGKYFESAIRGKIFHATLSSSGVALPQSGGATGALGLANPAGSGVNAALIKVVMTYVSGTIVLGNVYHAVQANPIGAAITGTVLTMIPGLVGSGFQPACTARSSAVFPAAPTSLRIFGAKNVTGATNPLIGQPVVDDVDGQIVLAPGTAWTLYNGAADTSPVVAISVTWEELPI